MNNVWSRKYHKCKKCKMTEVPHKAFGLCKRCYEKSKGNIWQKQYRERNLDAIRKWQREHPSLSQKKNWMKKMIERDGEKCKDCGSTENLTLEHLVPRCIGGKFSYENLEILCFKCNRKRWDQLIKKALTLYFKKPKGDAIV